MRPQALAGAGLLALTFLLGSGSASRTFAPAGRPSMPPSIEVSGIPVSIVYARGGPIAPGRRSTVVSFRPVISASVPIAVAITGSPFSGPMTLPVDTRDVRLGPGTLGLRRAPAADGRWVPMTTAQAWNPIYQSVRPVRHATFTISLRVRVPLAAPPGVYAGALELTFAPLSLRTSDVEPVDLVDTAPTPAVTATPVATHEPVATSAAPDAPVTDRPTPSSPPSAVPGGAMASPDPATGPDAD